MIGPFHAKCVTLKLKRNFITLESDDWLRKTYLQKWHEQFGKTSLEHKKVSKLWTFLGSFNPKYNIYELKVYRGVICYDNEEWCKIWKEIDQSLQNWHEEFNKFWPEHSKISKICTLMGCVWPRYIMFEFRKYR